MLDKRKYNGSFKKGNKINLGRKTSEETKRKQSLSMIGKNLGKKRTKKTLEKMSIAQRLEKGHNWKGENASVASKHRWIITYYGNPPKCEDCGMIGKKTGKIIKQWNIQWSNCDHKYRRVREDYRGRCQKCHWKYDGHAEKLSKMMKGKRPKQFIEYLTGINQTKVKNNGVLKAPQSPAISAT